MLPPPPDVSIATGLVNVTGLVALWKVRFPPAVIATFPFKVVLPIQSWAPLVFTVEVTRIAFAAAFALVTDRLARAAVDPMAPVKVTVALPAVILRLWAPSIVFANTTFDPVTPPLLVVSIATAPVKVTAPVYVTVPVLATVVVTFPAVLIPAVPVSPTPPFATIVPAVAIVKAPPLFAVALRFTAPAPVVVIDWFNPIAFDVTEMPVPPLVRKASVTAGRPVNVPPLSVLVPCPVV